MDLKETLGANMTTTYLQWKTYENILEIKIWTQSHGGLVQMIFLFNWVNFSLQPFIFQGCFLSVGRNATSIHQSWWMYPCVYVRLPSCGFTGSRLPFPHRKTQPQFQDGIFLVKGLRNFDVKIAGHPKAVVQKYIRNLMEKPGKNQLPYLFVGNRIFKDGS